MSNSSPLFSEAELLQILSYSPNATAVYSTEHLIIQSVNDAMLSLWGKNDTVVGLPLEQALPELEGQPFVNLLKDVWNTGESYVAKETLATLNVNGKLQDFYFDFVYEAIRNSDGSVYCILHTASNVTASVLSRRELLDARIAEKLLNEELAAANEELTVSNEELLQTQENLRNLNLNLERHVGERTRELSASEARIREIFEKSPLAICVLHTRDMVIETANQNILAIWGKGKEITGLPLSVALPELQGQPFLQLLDDVYTTGEPFRAYDMKAQQIHEGKPVDIYVDFVYSALKNSDGITESILISAIDVTEKALIRLREQNLNEEITAANEELTSTNEELFASQSGLQQLNTELEDRVARRTKALAESEAKFRGIIEQAPLGIALFDGPEHIIELANTNQLKFWGKNRSVIGKPHLQAIANLGEQPYPKILEMVYRTGKAGKGYEAEAVTMHNGALTKRYFNYVYEPVKDEFGKTTKVLLIADDVSDVVLARKELEKVRDILNLALESADVATWSADLVTDDLTFSEKGRIIHGFADDDKITLAQVIQLIIPEHRERISAAIENAVLTKASFVESYIIMPINGGELKWLKSTGKAYFDNSGNPLFVTGTMLDITEEILYEQQLQSLNEELSATNEELASANEDLIESNNTIDLNQRELQKIVARLTDSESRMRYMLADAPVGICLLNGRELVIEAANKKMLEGWHRDATVIGKPLHIALPEITGQPFLQLLDNSFTTGEPYYGNEVKALVEVNGVLEELYSTFVYHPLKGDDGNVTGIILVANVVTEQVLARKKIERAEEMLRFSIDAANVGTWYVDTKTREFLPSPRLKEIYGYTANAVMTYEAALAQIPDDYRDMVHNAIETCINNGNNYNVEHPVIGFSDKNIRWVRALGRLYPDAEGNLTNFSGLVIDITDVKMEEQRKDDFISIASHELKTPITSLKASLQLLNKLKDNPTASIFPKLVEQANKSSARVSYLIDDLLNFSKLNQGQLHLNKSVFKLSQVVNDCCSHIRMEGKYTITTTGDMDLEVFADPERIDQVIINYVNNAIKYAADSLEIVIRIENLGDKAKLSVTDKGAGIAPEKLPHLFDRYYRVDMSGVQYSGLGLGLYICSEIIKKHNGKTGVESEPGKGSTFWFTIPIH